MSIGIVKPHIAILLYTTLYVLCGPKRAVKCSCANCIFPNALVYLRSVRLYFVTCFVNPLLKVLFIYWAENNTHPNHNKQGNLIFECQNFYSKSNLY